MNFRSAVTAAACAGLIASTTGAFAYSGEQQFGHQAKITLDQARAIAVKARPGQITDQELEKEGGGSGLRFSFDVKSKAGKTYEVGVDAKTGKVLENKAEGPNAD